MREAVRTSVRLGHGTPKRWSTESGSRGRQEPDLSLSELSKLWLRERGNFPYKDYPLGKFNSSIALILSLKMSQLAHLHP
jgi:hypothetical protein